MKYKTHLKNCSILDTVSFDRFMCKLERINDRIYPCSTLKKTENNKIRRYILTLSRILAEVIYTPEFEIKSF